MRLTMDERRTLVKAFAKEYRKSSKKGKGKILDRFVAATEYHRSYAATLLRNHGRKIKIRRGVTLVGDATRRMPRTRRKRRYGSEVVKELEKLWALLDFIASKRLAPALKLVIPALERSNELSLDPAVRDKLMTISPATIDRMLSKARKRSSLKRRARTKPGSLLKHQIPIRTYADWDDAVPGFMEADLVAHEGGDARGDFCQTLDMTDVATGWTELSALKNKAQVWVFEAIEAVAARLPFPLQGFNSDNGSEFINAHLKRFCDANQITFTRARPYRKNDTCHVEQKNWSVVRRFVGYARYDTEEELDVLGELYEAVGLLTNFFTPSLKLKEKIRDGARVTRRYDQAKTPYQRVLESPHVSKANKEQLQQFAEGLNPAALSRQILRCQRRLKRIVDKKAKLSRRAVERAAPGGKASGFPTGAWTTPPEFPTPPTAQAATAPEPTTARVDS